jgi:hypothetical protein
MRKDGWLTVAFADGGPLVVPPDDRYETFTATRSLPLARWRFSFVSVPGSGMARAFHSLPKTRLHDRLDELTARICRSEAAAAGMSGWRLAPDLAALANARHYGRHGSGPRALAHKPFCYSPHLQASVPVSPV